MAEIEIEVVCAVALGPHCRFFIGRECLRETDQSAHQDAKLQSS
jgi:hypothetical protein